MRKNELLWYYYCLFQQNENSYIEEYTVFSTFLNRDYLYKRISSIGWDFICSKIHEALHAYEVEITRDEFKDCVLNGMYNPHRKWKRFRGRFRYGQTSKFVKKEHHKKKILTDAQIAKRDWDLEKGYRKDKNKNRGWRRRGPGVFYKRMSNKRHRNWEKDMIHHERWDLEYLDYRYFLDPWLWS